MPTRDHDEIAFDLDETLYPLEAVQSAAYAFTDRAFARVERAGAGRLTLTLTLKPGASGPSAAELRGEFDNELLHQVLRERVSLSNQKIREFIVTKALVSAQPSALVAAAAPDAAAGEAPCPECAGAASPAPAAPQIDAALEKEIDRLLAEIEGGDGAADPLGVSVPWEEAYGDKAKTEPKPRSKTKAAKAKRK